jgi:hypothetical protein
MGFFYVVESIFQNGFLLIMHQIYNGSSMFIYSGSFMFIYTSSFMMAHV